MEFMATKEYMKFEVIMFSSVQAWLNETLVKRLAGRVRQLRDHRYDTVL